MSTQFKDISLKDRLIFRSIDNLFLRVGHATALNLDDLEIYYLSSSRLVEPIGSINDLEIDRQITFKTIFSRLDVNSKAIFQQKSYYFLKLDKDTALCLNFLSVRNFDPDEVIEVISCLTDLFVEKS
jgi:hypothetical protein